MAKCYPQARFYAVDINPSHVERAKERAKELDLSNIEIMQGDLRDLDPLNLPPCDFITMMGVLSWIPLKLQRIALKNAAKLLSDKGLLATHYTAAPIAGLGRCAPGILAMLTPRGQQSSKEGATEAFKRFEKLYNSKIGIYPQLGPQYQSIHARFKIDPDYVVHDFFQSATTLSFEDFSDMAEENDLEFAASANLAQMLPEGFVSEAVMTQFDFSSDWIGSQPLIQTLTKEPVRIDIFARSGVAREPEEVFADGGVSNLYVSSLTDNLSTALQVKNSGSPIDLTGEAYSQLASLIGTGPHRIRDIIKQATDMLGSRTEVIRKLGHLIAYGLVSASVHDCAADDGQDDVSLKAFSYADDLWRYLALNRPLPIPSETLGGCFVFNNDAKIKLYLALGGDPNTLFNRVKRTPGFSDMRTQKGIVKSGQDLMTTVAPVLPGFKTAWQAIFKRFNII